MNSMITALAIIFAIAGTSAAIDDASDAHKIQKTAQKNLKLRRLYDDGEKMSMDSTEDSLGTGFGGFFGHGPSPTPNPPAPADGIACPSSSSGHHGLTHGCAPKGKVCEGFSFYKFRSKNNAWTWNDALKETPENCILAPIGSEEELVEVYAQYQDLAETANNGDGVKAWLGIRKSAFDVKNDNNGQGSRANWFNLDGTPAAVCDESAWKNGQPNNNLGRGKYAVMVFNDGKLNDFQSNVGGVKAAIYKCCEEGVTFTPASCGAATA